MVESTQTQNETKEYKDKFFVNDEGLRREYFAIAPMVDVSDNYFRYFVRLMTKHAFLYTEMINENAVIHACQGREKLLSFSPNQHPVVCQLGGNDPKTMAAAAKICQDQFGYDEVNINCGCPSNRVQKGAFGAVLMKDPELVASIVAEMKKECTIPITVKCRIGVDDHDKWEQMVEFIRIVSEKGGCTKFIIHARKCLLKGLDPKQNRTIPVLKYDWVFNLKKEFPHLNFVINGGFSNLEKVKDILKDSHPQRTLNGLEGCMSGRLAMNNPWECARIDRELFDDYTGDSLTREQIILKYADFAEEEQKKDLTRGINLSNNILVKPLVFIFQEEYQGGKWRKILNGLAADKKNKGQIREVIHMAVEQFKKINPDGLACRNGERFMHPPIEKSPGYLEEQKLIQASNQEQQKSKTEEIKTVQASEVEQDQSLEEKKVVQGNQETQQESKEEQI